MANPHYQAAKDAVKDALRIGIKYKKSDAEIRSIIHDKVAGLGGEVRGGIRLTRHESSLQAALSIVLEGALLSLNVQKRRPEGLQRAAHSIRVGARFDAVAARELILALNPGDKVKVTFADRTFDGDLKGRLLMLLGAFRESVDFGGKLASMNLVAVAESGKWEGFRTYTLTIREGFDAECFVSRTIGRELLESVERA